jgi:hypothetical protein
MQKRKYTFIALLVGLLVVLLAIADLFLKRQEHLAQRYHLLCAVLKPGMSKDEVLNVLKQAGEFTAVGTESPGPVIELHIVFTDPEGKDLYGAFDLGFSDYKYVSAYISGFEYSDVICDFYRPTKSVTETPKPMP